MSISFVGDFLFVLTISGLFGATVSRSIFNVVLIAVVDAQMKCAADTREAINNSKWWKKFKRKSHNI